MTGAKLAAEPRLEDLSAADLEACELAAHAAVPDDATDAEAQAIYADAFRKLARKRRRPEPLLAFVDLSEFDDEED